MTQDATSAVPSVRLDPAGSDHHGEAARLRGLGPVVRVILPGEITAWAVTDHQHLAALVRRRGVNQLALR
jgi:2-hydroxy-5-methyl-1-naphthoate 7-hydroxylase